MVEGVALELLCRLLLIEGSNPSLSLPSPNLPILLTTIDQIAMDTTSPTVRPLFDMDSIFLVVRKTLLKKRVDKEWKYPSRSMTPKWKKNPDKTLIYLNLRLIYFAEREQNWSNPSSYLFLLFIRFFFFFFF